MRRVIQDLHGWWIILFSIILSTAVVAQPTQFFTNYGSPGDDKAYSGIPTLNNEYVLAGYSNGFATFPVVSEGLYFSILDMVGNVKPTSKLIADQNDQRAYFIDYSFDAAGNQDGYIMTGYHRNGPGVFEDLLLVKTDLNGNVLATLAYGMPDFQEIGYCVRQDMDMNYVATGYLFDGLNKYIFVVKASNNLLPIWANIYPVYDGTNVFDDEGQSIVMANNIFDPSGQPIDQAYALTGKVKDDVFVMLIDRMGNHLMSTRTDVFLGSQDIGYSIQQDYDNGFIVTGSTITAPGTIAAEWIFVHKTDMMTIPMFTNIYDFFNSEREHGRFIQLDGTGYILTGRAYQPGAIVVPPGDYGKAYLLSLDPAANVLWANTYLDPTLDGTHGNRVEVIPGGFFLSGYTWVNEEIDPPLVNTYYDKMALTTDLLGHFPASGSACELIEEIEMFPVEAPFEINIVDPIAFVEPYEPPMEAIDVVEPQCFCWSCPLPPNISTVQGLPGSGVIHFSWTRYPCHWRFQGKGRKVGTLPFGHFITFNNFKNVGGLASGTAYEWKLRAQCYNMKISPFSPLMPFTAPVMPPEMTLKESDASAERLKVSPNPASEVVTINYLLPGDNDYRLTIYDYTGRLISENVIPGVEGSIDIETMNFAEGFYWLTITDGMDFKVQSSFVISH